MKKITTIATVILSGVLGIGMAFPTQALAYYCAYEYYCNAWGYCWYQYICYP
jgi:hypothetical protein